jgi:hypothetical protein
MTKGEKHEPKIDTYAIGSADTLEIDYIGGTDTVHFDLKQIKENNFVRYFIEGFGHGVYYDSPEISEDESLVQCWIDDIDSRTGYDIRAVLVPEYMSENFKSLEGYEVRYVPRL